MLSLGVSGNLSTCLQGNCRVDIQFVLVVLPVTQSIVLLVASKEPKHVEIREVVSALTTATPHVNPQPIRTFVESPLTTRRPHRSSGNLRLLPKYTVRARVDLGSCL